MSITFDSKSKELYDNHNFSTYNMTDRDLQGIQSTFLQLQQLLERTGIVRPTTILTPDNTQEKIEVAFQEGWTAGYKDAYEELDMPQ